MTFLFLNSHPTFIREVVSVGKKVSEASLQIVPKYLSQTWRARSNYCCQPPFKVLLTQVANQLKNSPHSPMYQSDSGQRQGFFVPITLPHQAGIELSDFHARGWKSDQGGRNSMQEMHGNQTKCMEFQPIKESSNF